ncbi:MAG TPA: DUF4404 family protein [Acidimicrobiia bacterium]|nr:DUF4404 family protein [Acidimicrobiia bacterium]
MENHLRHLLDEISAAIGRVTHHDDREELTRLQGAVEGRLDGRAGEDDHPGLLDSLEKAEIRFEADHPTLAQSLRQAIQGLSSSGI